MASLVPHDVMMAAKRVCQKYAMGYETLDWLAVWCKRDHMAQDEYEALSLFCKARGEYARHADLSSPEGLVYELDESGMRKWIPGDGDFDVCRIIFKQMGLIKEVHDG